MIELLVVIAIIGILASIVLVSFPGATDKANDSRVITAIGQARTAMTYLNANNNSYATFSCTTPVDMVNLCAEVTNKAYTGGLNIEVSAAAACMWASLNEQDGATWYCADSSGIAGKSTNPDVLSACDGTTFVCPTGTGI